MAGSQPQIGDRVLYRGAYREVIGWQDGPGEPVTEDRGPIIAYRNPETGRNTYSREEDLAYSEHYEAWYPVGLLLSRAECVVYAALPTTLGNDVPRAQQHEPAARMLEGESLELSDLSASDRETLENKIRGYWPDDPPDAEQLFEAASELREHRREVQDDG